jgi:hypothetical protein
MIFYGGAQGHQLGVGGGDGKRSNGAIECYRKARATLWSISLLYIALYIDPHATMPAQYYIAMVGKKIYQHNKYCTIY